MPDYVARLMRGGFEARPYRPPPPLLLPAGGGGASSGSGGSGSSGSGGADGLRLGGLKLEAGALAAGAYSHSKQQQQQRFSYQSLSSSSSSSSSSKAAAAAAAPGPHACASAFTAAGSRPRSLAVILIKWRREYYPPRGACCPGAAAADPSCDCTWGGHKYDALPGAEAYERAFSDECDGFSSINRVRGRAGGVMEGEC